MQPRIVISLCIASVCLNLCAEGPPRPGGGDFARQFPHYDQNGDGNVTRTDDAQLPMFAQRNANKEGAVTLDEVTAFHTMRRVARTAAEERPAATGRPAHASNQVAAADGFAPDAPFVGEINGSYIDPDNKFISSPETIASTTGVGGVS
jgi:hypothetical protein